MYNIDFLHQIEQSRRHFFGNLDPRYLPISVNYYHPIRLRTIDCVENVNGEWVPKRTLEGKSSSD